MKANTYFKEMEKTLREWRIARDEHIARKQTIIDTYGWESEELKAWYHEADSVKYPFNGGAAKAFKAWTSSISRGQNELELDDFLWANEVQDFVEALRSAGIKSFVYTNESTAVMENLHSLVAEGCEMTGLCTITRMEDHFGCERPEEIRGIRFTVK